jgi:hypothetical protein
MDVFLEPLMEDMKILWKIGVQILDEYRKESFTLRAIIFVTINDYPALFTLLGQFKGEVGCVVCYKSSVDKGCSHTVVLLLQQDLTEGD